MKLLWANLLHIYQPPTQTEGILRKVAQEAYEKIVLGLENTPKAKITLNINGSLTEQLVKYGYDNVIRGFANLAERGQVEFTGSACYHPILPLIPENEIVRQIRLNEEINRRYFGKIWQPKGFFPPELSVSPDLTRILKKLGYEWMVADELAYNGKFNKVKSDRVYEEKEVENFYVFFRDRGASDLMSWGAPKTGTNLVFNLKKFAEDSDEYLFTALDGETFGHHHRGLDEVLMQAYKETDFEPSFLTSIVKQVKQKEEVSITPCSWSSNDAELASGISYGLWKHPQNEIHRLQWSLTGLAVQAFNQSQGGSAKPPKNIRTLLDRALHSDQYWWASSESYFGKKRIKIHWGMIMAGAFLLNEVVQEAPAVSSKTRGEAQKIYNRLVDLSKS